MSTNGVMPNAAQLSLDDIAPILGSLHLQLLQAQRVITAQAERIKQLEEELVSTTEVT
jgi:hypothetical protein